MATNTPWTRGRVEDAISTLLQEQLGVDADEITPRASLVDTLGADSLDMVEIVMACEETFGLEIADDDAERLMTVEQLVDYLCRRLQGLGRLAGV